MTGSVASGRGRRWLLALVVIAIALFGAAVAIASTSRFDVAAYASALQDANHRDHVAHFPVAFDADLRPVAFLLQHPILQGGGTLELLCRSTRCDALWEGLRPRFAYTSRGVGSYFLEDGKGSDRPLTRLALDDGRDLGPEWEIGVLISEDRGDHWNHGRCAGVAIRRDRGEVLYFSDLW